MNYTNAVAAALQGCVDLPLEDALKKVLALAREAITTES